jgi:uncharacterized protein YfaS (alpha-2-macroglobulin family)
MALFRVIAPHVLFFRVETRDASLNNILANPSNVRLTVFRPDGTEELTDQAMTNAAIGVWTLNHELPASSQVGSWTSKIRITDAVGDSVFRSVSFDVVQ